MDLNYHRFEVSACYIPWWIISQSPNPQQAFNIQLGLTKAQRLQTNESSMTHAMVISGVHVDEKTGQPVRFKVENSWGEDSCYKGYMVMSAEWFDQYVP